MARVSGFWKKIGSAIEPAIQGGADLLLRGVNRYLNFGNDSGETGYGLRDNDGVLEFKNNAGVWAPFSSSVPIAFNDLSDVTVSATDPGTANGTFWVDIS